MKTIRILVGALLAAIFSLVSAIQLYAQGTAFTYQGRLHDGGAPGNGVYDLEFRVFDALSGGSQQGGTVTVDDLSVTNGLFSATLDFGSVAFSGGANRWLNVAVRPGASAAGYTTSSPQAVTLPICAAPILTAANKTATVARVRVLTFMALSLSAQDCCRLGPRRFMGECAFLGKEIKVLIGIGCD